MNSIRPHALASLRADGEAWNRMPTREGQGNSVGLCFGETVCETGGVHGVVGDRMAGSWSDVNWGSRSGERSGVHGLEKPEEPRPEGDRASIVVWKRGNSRGAKGGREIEANRRGVFKNTTLDSALRAVHRVGRQIRSEASKDTQTGAYRRNHTRRSGLSFQPDWLSADDLLRGANYLLESRMREIRLSGSEGGATSSIVAPTPIPEIAAAPLSLWRCPKHPALQN